MRLDTKIPAMLPNGSLAHQSHAVSQVDDWCGKCIRSQPGNSLTMLRAVDIGMVIISEMGTCVPWHVEDNCRSSQFLPCVRIDHASCAN